MVLDSVLTLAIGRNGADGKPLSDGAWSTFQGRARTILEKYATVVAHTSGNGVGSDDVNDGQAEESAVIVAINPKDAERARKELAKLLPKYGQGSAAFAVDRAHEPVFATESGYRL